MTTAPDKPRVTSRDIIRAISRGLWSPFSYSVAYNTTGVLPWEADMVVLSRAGYISEIEIKISLSDFKADFTGKPEKHEMLVKGFAPNKWCGRWVRDWDKAEAHAVKHFWYAIPGELQMKIEPLLPDYAGLIVVDKWATVVRKAPVLKQHRKATDAEHMAILRSMYYRGWEQFRVQMSADLGL